MIEEGLQRPSWLQLLIKPQLAVLQHAPITPSYHFHPLLAHARARPLVSMPMPVLAMHAPHYHLAPDHSLIWFSLCGLINYQQSSACTIHQSPHPITSLPMCVQCMPIAHVIVRTVHTPQYHQCNTWSNLIITSLPSDPTRWSSDLYLSLEV